MAAYRWDWQTMKGFKGVCQRKKTTLRMKLALTDIERFSEIISEITKYTSDTSAVDESFHFLADNICTPSQERAVVAELEASVDPNIDAEPLSKPAKAVLLNPSDTDKVWTLEDFVVNKPGPTIRSKPFAKNPPVRPKKASHGSAVTPKDRFINPPAKTHAPQKKKTCRPRAVGAPPTLPSSSKFCKNLATPGDAGVKRKLITDSPKKTPTPHK
ncbi:UNVERIFIED_CONTAM: hypothetical protein FKN15_027843 [Acipenser sinensis]